MAPDTWDPATRQASIEGGGTSPYISISDDKTQIWILKQKKEWEGQMWFSVRLKEGEKAEAVMVNKDVMCTLY